jgi:hypothetical protein
MLNGMSGLTRRRGSEQGQPQRGLIWYDGVNVGQIRERHRAPPGSDAGQLLCGFYPGSNPGEQRMGTASTYEAAREAFAHAWAHYLPRRTAADFYTWRHHSAWTGAECAARDRGEGARPCRYLDLISWTSSVTSGNWDDEFDWPIPLPGGGEHVTFREAGDYISELPKREHDKPGWQLAIKDLMRAAAGHEP